MSFRYSITLRHPDYGILDTSGVTEEQGRRYLFGAAYEPCDSDIVDYVFESVRRNGRFGGLTPGGARLTITRHS